MKFLAFRKHINAFYSTIIAEFFCLTFQNSLNLLTAYLFDVVYLEALFSLFPGY